MMTLALLPLGLISILQTTEITETLQQHARISILAQTEQAALGERRIVLSARGAASALGAALPELSRDVDDCRGYLRQFVDTSSEFVHAAFIPLSGQVTCTSSGVTLDLSPSAAFKRQLAQPRVRVSSAAKGVMSGAQVVVVTVPIFRTNELAGWVSVSVPAGSISDPAEGENVARPLSSIMFNGDGEVVTIRSRGPEEPGDLPAAHSLVDLIHGGSQVFVDRTVRGALRTFAVVPLIPGTAYVMSAWPPPKTPLSEGLVQLAPVAFPLAMWAASLLVGYLAIHRLVVRHVRTLGSEMRTFARSRRVSPDAGDSGMSEELVQIREEFLRMAETVLKDEAAIEDALREKNDLLAQKNVLMKEVHHRVKNNLQLISSIMNMQIRKSRSVETKAIIQRLQERVLGLATVHRNLYQAGELGAINAGKLVREIAEQMLTVGARQRMISETRVENVILFPDQAVPLSLLTAEAVTNALKYGDAEGGKSPWIRIELSRVNDHHAQLKIENSLTRSNNVTGDATSDGLGTQLIRAFAAQLGSDAKVTAGSESFSICVEFPIEDFRPALDEPAMEPQDA